MFGQRWSLCTALRGQLRAPAWKAYSVGGQLALTLPDPALLQKGAPQAQLCQQLE